MKNELTPKDIFAANQRLTVETAKKLHGKKISCTSAEYQANTPHVSTFIVGEIVSDWDNAARSKPMGNFANQQEYWKSYMNPDQVEEYKTRLLILSDTGEKQFVAHTKFFNFYPEPTFTGSDADREVYYIEIEEPQYIIWNNTDGITATPDTYETIQDAEIKIAAIRDRFSSGQGYYKDNRGNRIDPAKVDYQIIPADKLGEAVRNYKG